MKTKCYIVTSYGGRWEDSWTSNLCVFLDKEKAQKYKQEYDSISEEDLKISIEEYEKLEDELDEWVSSKDITRLIHSTHPEYSLEELEKTGDFRYRMLFDWVGTMIEEVDLCQ